MAFTISRYCPCGDSEIIGDFKDTEIEPYINCVHCREEYYFFLQMKWDGWEGTYWYEWIMKRK